jgi:hypothetical protein
LSFSKSTRVWLITAIGIASLLVGSAIPTAIHIHDGGDQLHVHDTVMSVDSELTHLHDADHAGDRTHHSHNGPHHHHHGSHKHTHFGHAHTHEHRTEAYTDSKSTSRVSQNRLPKSSTPHVHLVIFGFEFALSLPQQQTAPVEQVIKREGSPIITIVRHVATSPVDGFRAIEVPSGMVNENGRHFIACTAPSRKVPVTFPTLLVPRQMCLRIDIDAAGNWNLPTDDHFPSVVQLVESPPPRSVLGLT